MHPTVTVVETGDEFVRVLQEARTLWAQFRGLMWRPPLWHGDGLLLRGCGAIHTLFVRFPIDAVFFDRNYRVVRVARSVRPWTGVAFGGFRAAGVIELPEGGAARLEPGMHLQFSLAGQ